MLESKLLGLKCSLTWVAEEKLKVVQSGVLRILYYFLFVLGELGGTRFPVCVWHCECAKERVYMCLSVCDKECLEKN